MDGGRTENWLITRFELAVAVFAVLAIVIVIVFAPMPFSDPYPSIPAPFGNRVPATLFCRAVAAVGALVGLIWTIRIFRGPRDEPPPWRYRDG